MSPNRRKLAFAVLAVLVLPAIGWWMLAQFGLVAPIPGKPSRPPFNMSDRIATIKVQENDAGELVATFSGRNLPDPLTAEEFFNEIHIRQVDLPWIFQVLDVTSVTSLLWILFGFAAQGIFAGRMIVQWYASEKAKSSVVPNQFWWMSLIGASMLIIYFIWRKEIVGICGQLTGWLVYVRNLWMIYGKAGSQESGTQ